MEPVAEMLDNVARVVRWDQRGCGRSTGSSGPLTYDRFMQDLDSVRRHWDISSTIVGGHSGGAALALFYAISHRESVQAVIYLSGTGLGWSRRDADRYRTRRAARLGSFNSRWNELRSSQLLTEAERRELTVLTFSTDFGDTSPETILLAEEWLDERFTPNSECNTVLGQEMQQREMWAEERLPSLNCPVLIVHGRSDPRPAAGAEDLAAALPRATLCLLDDVGHLPWAQHPERLATELRRFVALTQVRTLSLP